jgi:hypothetical protein
MRETSSIATGESHLEFCKSSRGVRGQGSSFVLDIVEIFLPERIHMVMSNARCVPILCALSSSPVT